MGRGICLRDITHSIYITATCIENATVLQANVMHKCKAGKAGEGVLTNALPLSVKFETL